MLSALAQLGTNDRINARSRRLCCPSKSKNCRGCVDRWVEELTGPRRWSDFEMHSYCEEKGVPPLRIGSAPGRR